MAKTAFATNNPLTKKAWDTKLFVDIAISSYFSKFMGTTPDYPIQVCEELMKMQGDTVTFGIPFRLVGQGVGPETSLEGNEQRISTSSFTTTLTQRSFGVRDSGPMDRQRAMFSIDDVSVELLKRQVTEYLDKVVFDTLTASPTKVIWAGTATADNNITSTDKLTLDRISWLKAGAMTGWNRKQTPIQPFLIDGYPHYVLIVHPDQMYDIYESAQFQQAQRDAQIRGDENPLFTGAKAVWNGVIIHEHERVPIVSNFGSGANVYGAKSMLLGSQAMVWAWGKRPEVNAQTFNYGMEHGYGMTMIYGAAKTHFTYSAGAADYGYAEIHAARSRISDAA